MERLRPDVGEAVESPRRLTDERARALRVLDLVPHVPTAVWGRDELETGDMWNSNSRCRHVVAIVRKRILMLICRRAMVQ